MSLKNFDWRLLIWIEDVPVVDARVGHQSQRRLIKEFPEDYILNHSIALEFGFVFKVEYLQSPRLSFERNDELVPVHDGAVSLDRSANDIVGILEVDDDDFGLRVVVNLLTDADIVIGFKSLLACVSEVRKAHCAVLTQELKPIDAG